MNQKRKTESTILLRQHFLRPQLLYTPGNLDKFLIGLATQPSQNFDNHFSEEVKLTFPITTNMKRILDFESLKFIFLNIYQMTNHMFEVEGTGFGLDLVSINIQRGRDHGKIIQISN